MIFISRATLAKLKIMNLKTNKKIIIFLNILFIALIIFSPSTVQSALSISCSADPQFAKPGESVTWTATVQGGVGSVSWSGEGNPRGVGVNARSSYDTFGIKKMTATVTDPEGNKASATCSATINTIGKKPLTPPKPLGGGETVKQKKPAEFVPLETIPGIIEKGNTDLNQFFNGLFTFGIVIAGFLAVVMIAVGGIQYMSTDAVSGKGEGRERITYALMGLLLILFSWILLNTINPDILNFSTNALFK